MALLKRVQQLWSASPTHIGAAALLAAGGCWGVASGISPLWADNIDESSLVAMADGEGENKQEGKVNSERREGDGRKEGEQKEGDRPREGEAHREGDRPQPPGPAADFRRRMAEVKSRVEALIKEGKTEEAEALKREAYERMQRFQREHGGERPFHEIPADVREKAEALKRKMNEAREAGKRDEVTELELQLRELIREHLPKGPPPHEGDRPRPEGGPRDGFRPEGGTEGGEMFRVIRELRAEVERLRHEVEALKGGRHGEGQTGPRPDGPPREGDRPRFEGRRPDGPRFEGRRPDGPPRDGDRPEGDRPPREQPQGGRPAGDGDGGEG